MLKTKIKVGYMIRKFRRHIPDTDKKSKCPFGYKCGYCEIIFKDKKFRYFNYYKGSGLCPCSKYSKKYIIDQVNRFINVRDTNKKG